jgi:ferrochelatase
MTTGVVVMAYGTPQSIDEVEEYYTHIRRGRAPSADQVADLIARYESIGGISPLARHTEAQRAALQATLDDLAPDNFVTAVGNKHARPFIEDTVAGLAERCDAIVGAVLAPHYSDASVGDYHRRASAAAVAANTSFDGVDRWFDLDAFVAHQAGAVVNALVDLPEPVMVVFTAHSLPERVLDGDAYPEELADSAARIASRAGLDDHRVGWQSAGATPEPWRGPDIAETIRTARKGGANSVLVVPHGFTSEHLEVLYDLDVVAAGVAESQGLDFARTQVVGDDPAVMAALAQRILDTAALRR